MSVMDDTLARLKSAESQGALEQNRLAALCLLTVSAVLAMHTAQPMDVFSPRINLPLVAEATASHASRLTVEIDVGGRQPRTILGRRLMALRQQAIERGMVLLSEDEVLNEVRRRRGEIPG